MRSIKQRLTRTSTASRRSRCCGDILLLLWLLPTPSTIAARVHGPRPIAAKRLTTIPVFVRLRHRLLVGLRPSSGQFGQQKKKSDYCCCGGILRTAALVTSYAFNYSHCRGVGRGAPTLYEPGYCTAVVALVLLLSWPCSSSTSQAACGIIGSKYCCPGHLLHRRNYSNSRAWAHKNNNNNLVQKLCDKRSTRQQQQQRRRSTASTTTTMPWGGGASAGTASGSNASNSGGTSKWRPTTTITALRGAAPPKTRKKRQQQQQFAIDRLLTTTTTVGPALAKDYYEVEGDDSDSDDTATTVEALTSSASAATNVQLSSKRLKSVRPATTPMRRYE